VQFLCQHTLVAPTSINKASLVVDVTTLVTPQVCPGLLLLLLLPGVPLLLTPLLPPVSVWHHVSAILLAGHVTSVLLVGVEVAAIWVGVHVPTILQSWLQDKPAVLLVGVDVPAILLAWLLLEAWLCKIAQSGVQGLLKP
jgi:hypothetical protein